MTNKAGIILIAYSYGKPMVLVVKSYDNKWGFPKGHYQENDKNLINCAKREFYEETQIPIQIDNETPFFVFDEEEMYYIVFVEEPFNLKILHTHEITDAMWLPMNSRKYSHDVFNRGLRGFIRVKTTTM